MRTRRFVAASAALFLLAGCGGSSDSPDPQNPTTPASEWELVWSDEFDASDIDSDKWSHEVNCAGGGNNELQCYTGRSENSYVEDGKLYIVAREESYSGPGHFDDDPSYDPDDTSAERDYTSARLRSKNKGDWRYGRMEIHAQMPRGQGVWPALWMMPTDSEYGGWAASGEIDIFEAINTGTPEFGNEIHGTLHYGGQWPDNRCSGKAFTPETSISENFHTYAIEWEEGEIRWYVDDTHFATQTQAGWFTYYWAGQERGFQLGEGAAPFNERFHLIMNVAIGGNWPGAPDQATEFPQSIVVDYVRVYQCSEDSETGRGCASDIDETIEPLNGNPAPEQNSFGLYSDGPDTLMLNEDTEITLVPDFYEQSAGNVVSEPGNGDSDGDWSVMFNGPGNVFLTAMAVDEQKEDGVKFTNMNRYGELRFNLLIENIDPDVQLLVKLDSGWPNVSFYTLELPETGEWTSVSVPFAELQANDIEPGQVDMNRIINPFVIEAVGGIATIKLNDIHVVCLADCAVDPVLAGVSSVLDESFEIYSDGQVGVNWDFGTGSWDDNTGHVTIETVDEAERGEVLEVKFTDSNNNGLMFIQSTSPKDVSAFVSDGQLEFELKVLSYGSNTSGLVVKAESGPATGTGDYVLEPAPELAEWTPIVIPIADMIDHPGTSPNFDISALNTPFVFLPVWGDQAGVQVRLDNIRWTR